MAIWIKREAFDEILAEAVDSSFLPEVYPSRSEWEKALKRSQLRLQWDRDHHPSGTKLKRRAIQQGLRGRFLAAYSQDWIVNIEDISEFVQQQRQNIKCECAQLIAPRETVYSVFDSKIAKKLGLFEYPACTE